MDKNCDCIDWHNLIENFDLFKWEPPYGWVMKWIQVTKEKGYSQIHRYGIPIQYCPICGTKLSEA